MSASGRRRVEPMITFCAAPLGSPPVRRFPTGCKAAGPWRPIDSAIQARSTPNMSPMTILSEHFAPDGRPPVNRPPLVGRSSAVGVVPIEGHGVDGYYTYR
ncbi:hypothetical protein ACFOLD_11540 [Kocuria carniphila]|uniref:hypothetical protein n=1 Tax=Kocuria carniphila TaxID=262208 RepID=UPI00360B8A42